MVFSVLREIHCDNNVKPIIFSIFGNISRHLGHLWQWNPETWNMNAKLTWKFLERGSAVKAEIFLRTHLGGDSGEFYGVILGNLQKTYPPRPNTGYANSIGNSWSFSWLCLKILSWKTCHWSVINSTGASPDVDQRTVKLDTKSTRNTLMAAPKTRGDTERIDNGCTAHGCMLRSKLHQFSRNHSRECEAAGLQLLST